jgi:hypothetical protein
MRNVRISYFFLRLVSVAGEFSSFFAGRFWARIAAYKSGIESIIAINVFICFGR